MDVCSLFEEIDSDFYTGVPDSYLKPLCDYLMDELGISNHHIIAANEGNSVALAAGYYLATGKNPVIYMQNSGIGNIVNPVTSLLNEKVYGIPCVFIIGWRGEPGTYDEPQHIFQGEITTRLLHDIGIYTMIVSADTPLEELKSEVERMHGILDNGRSVAFLLKKGAVSYDKKVSYSNNYMIIREKAIEHIVDVTDQDAIISTTGKISRELFEIRERRKQTHQYDFLTVGSMGHSSSIALGIALSKPDKKIWCIDGDGAALMHMGSMATIGSKSPSNMIHIIMNNESHETVGGMPTVSSDVDWKKIGFGCGYPYVASVVTYEELDVQLSEVKKRNTLSLIEIKCAINSRIDLGRPTTTCKENMIKFMKHLQTK